MPEHICNLRELFIESLCQYGQVVLQEFFVNGGLWLGGGHADSAEHVFAVGGHGRSCVLLAGFQVFFHLFDIVEAIVECSLHLLRAVSIFGLPVG